MKVLGANSFILGTRKLWRSFPIKQKCHMTAAFLDTPNFSIWSNLDIFLPLCIFPGVQISCTMDYHKNCPVLNIFITRMVWKKAAVIFNFCLIGNIHHNFLVPRMIESAPKTFMPIQTPDLHRVMLFEDSLYLMHNCTFDLGVCIFLDVVFTIYIPMSCMFFYRGKTPHKWREESIILLHSGLNLAWHLWLSTRFSCQLITF